MRTGIHIPWKMKVVKQIRKQIGLLDIRKNDRFCDAAIST